MKFVVEQRALLAPLQRAARVAARRTTIPILSHVRIETLARGVRLTGNDMEREVVVELDAQVERKGATTTPAHELARFVASLDDGSQVQVELQGGKERLALQSGKAKAAFPTLPIDEYPTFTEAAIVARFDIEGAAFAAALQSVAHAQSDEETRIYLNGTYLHRRSERELVFVATDGHRLARTAIELPQALPENLPGVIVPRRAVDDIHALAEEAGVIEIAVGHTMLRASADRVVLSTKLIDGTFPDYERVIPAADIPTGFEAGRVALMTAARRCDLASDGKDHTVKLAPAGNALALLAGRSDASEIADEIEATTSTKIPVGVNPRYLQPALEALGGTTVRVRYADAGAPIAFTNPDQPNKLQIIMAKRVG